MTNHRLSGTHGHLQGAISGPNVDPSPGGTSPGFASLQKVLVNESGGDLELGDVVVLKVGAGDREVDTTSTPADVAVVGVVAGLGPYADGASLPVLTFGYHATVKIVGAAAPGDYLQTSSTPGAAEVASPPGSGAFARAVAADDAGLVEAIVFAPHLGAAVNNFVDLLDVPNDYSGAGLQAVRVKGAEDGLEFVNFPSGGSIEYDPKRAPSSPDAVNDEFDDLSLDAAWTTTSSGTGSSGVVNETDRKGFIHTRVQDGGSGSGRGMYKTWVPGSGQFTAVARVFGNVGNNGSNQQNLTLWTSTGTFVVCCGMLNGTQAIFNHAGGFSGHNRTYITGNVGEVWLMIRRDASTGIDAYVSGDGHIWSRLTGATITGVVGRIGIDTAAFGSSFSEGWWDFIRVFDNVETFDIGGTP